MTDTPTQSVPESPKRPVLWTNWITLGGLLFVGIGLVLMLTFWLFELIFPATQENQYLGLIGFMILPGILVNGLIMCPMGIWLRKRKLKKRGKVKAISVKSALTFLGVTFFLILPVLGVAGYKGYHFTESAEFCGTICHNMDPQYVRYNQSAHARVTCAGCHIGPGASPFVKSKLSGIRQVFKTVLDTYPRPVPPAIHELRPARETCEQCHWPSRFFGSKLKKIPHYSPDEKNTLNTYEVLVKVGGLNKDLGQAEGIHMHMLDRVEYVTNDHASETIPWVRYTNGEGKTTIYRNDGKASGEPPPAGKLRKLDCIDCHNLSGHEFLSPERAVDHALSVKHLDTSLPYIKREAVRVLSQTYQTKEEALEKIGQALPAYYKEKQPEVWSKRQGDVDKAVGAVREIYKTQMFPEMKTDWRTYPNHIGHMESAGCFRCHDDLHVSDEGKRISADCKSCHSFLYRQTDAKGLEVIRERTFDHPMKIHEEWEGLGPHQKMSCTDCHDGGLGALGWREAKTASSCGSCHPSGRWVEMREEIRRREAATRPAENRAPGR
jgi:nitrate/TMAO reductase-like tetraheme cytochrome c subunit